MFHAEKEAAEVCMIILVYHRRNSIGVFSVLWGLFCLVIVFFIDFCVFGFCLCFVVCVFVCLNAWGFVWVCSDLVLFLLWVMGFCCRSFVFVVCLVGLFVWLF